MIWTLALLPAATGLMIWTLGSASRVALAVLGGAVMVGIAVLSALEPAPASFVWAPDFPLLLDLTDTARAVALTVSVIGLAVLIFAAFHALWKLEEAGAEVVFLIAQYNPFTYAVELVRFALYGQLNMQALVVVSAAFLIFFLLAVWGYDPQKGVVARRKG